MEELVKAESPDPRKVIDHTNAVWDDCLNTLLMVHDELVRYRESGHKQMLFAAKQMLTKHKETCQKMADRVDALKR